MEICHAFLLLLVHSWSQGVSAFQQKQFEHLLQNLTCLSCIQPFRPTQVHFLHGWPNTLCSTETNISLYFTLDFVPFDGFAC
jgi:hypothetical protein